MRISQLVPATVAAVTMIGLGVSSAHAAPPTAVLGGSSGIVLGASSGCSLASIGYDGDGRLVGLTAGHCAPVGAPVRAEKALDIGVLGTVAVSDRGTGLDYAVVEFDASKVTPVRSVGATTISGIAAPPGPGATVCANGRSSGFDCGVVWGSLNGQVITQSCSVPGDSGGPVTIGDQLVGMNLGRLTGLGPVQMNIPCVDAAMPVHAPERFRPIDQILQALDAGGGVGAGFRPV
ncbi:S1 family peptidase [Nocardia sp. NPDC058058]|uniref:S1 family peptidase n=1 Tax=Nocardia sp. NPDC058058 TaxID=3346317 RepID=UPI0036DA714B